MYKPVIMLLACVCIGLEIKSGLSDDFYLSEMRVQEWIWIVVASSQMLITKFLRVPIAPGKWYDFTYVPMWVLVFTLPGPVAFATLIVFSMMNYLIFPQQFYCRKSVGMYVFHLSYQVILFYATIEGFHIVMQHLDLSIGNLPLTATVAMFTSMFALMIVDTVLGSWVQYMEGQRSVLREWRTDYWRITLVQTLLSTIAMLFAALYLTEHYIQLTVAYCFFILGVVVMYRATFRQDHFLGLIKSMITMVEIKDTYTKNHSESVGHYSVVIGQLLGFSAARLERLKIAAQLHDIGKVGIPDHILKKEGPLTDEEYEIMKTHAALGEKVIAPILPMREVATIIGRHHEHLSGTGYPYKLSGDSIPLEARIITVADAYHAMISHRPYRRGIPIEEALRRLHQSSSTQFDPKIVELFSEYARNPARHNYRFRPFCLVH